MTQEMHTGNYHITYTQSVVDSLVLWESHCHACFELIGVLEGDITVALEGKYCRLTKNQAVIIPPLCYHTITANKQGAYHRITALFDGAVIPEPMREDFSYGAVFYASAPEEMKKVFSGGSSPFYAPLAEALMTKSFYEYFEAKQGMTATEADDFLQKTISYIDDHLGEKITVGALAELTARSKSSFCHLFAQKMKISPKQYILQKKLALAYKLIHEGMPPTAAAFCVGYDNYSNFYRMYIKRYGTAPVKSR